MSLVLDVEKGTGSGILAYEQHGLAYEQQQQIRKAFARAQSSEYGYTMVALTPSHVKGFHHQSTCLDLFILHYASDCNSHHLSIPEPPEP